MSCDERFQISAQPFIDLVRIAHAKARDQQIKALENEIVGRQQHLKKLKEKKQAELFSDDDDDVSQADGQTETSTENVIDSQQQTPSETIEEEKPDSSPNMFQD